MEAARSGVVTLITDFGLQDPYVGQLKGALLSIYRSLTIVDITHAVNPHDIQSAGYALAASYRHFPAGTVHLVVVDPGVGSSRAILAARGEGHFFIAPDNGILSPLFHKQTIDTIHRLDMVRGEAISATFHGRDIMAPAAALLAKGQALATLGPAVEKQELVITDTLPLQRVANGLIGQVIRIDHFGNIRTSIRAEDIQSHLTGDERIAIGDQVITGVSKTYAEHPQGTLCALIDSDGFLEIAVTMGNGAALLNVSVGEKIRFTC